MPQLQPAGGGNNNNNNNNTNSSSSSNNSSSSDDLGAPDELIPFQDEGGDEQDKASGGRDSEAHGDLDELKSSLVHESESRGGGGGNTSGSDSEAERPPQQPRESFQPPRESPAEVLRRQQEGGFFKGPPYPSYPFLMIPELGSPYLPSGALSPGGARTIMSFWFKGLNNGIRSKAANSSKQQYKHKSLLQKILLVKYGIVRIEGESLLQCCRTPLSGSINQRMLAYWLQILQCAVPSLFYKVYKKCLYPD